MTVTKRLWAGGVVLVAGVTSLSYWGLLSEAQRQERGRNDAKRAPTEEHWESAEAKAAAGLGRMRIVSASRTGAQSKGNPGDEPSGSSPVVTESVARQRVLKPASLGRPQSELPRGLKPQLAAAVRESDTQELMSLVSQAYGYDRELDGLLIEASRRLGQSNEPEAIALAGARLSEFRAVELARFHGSQGGVTLRSSIGALVQIAEAFGDVRGELSSAESAALVGDPSLPRVVRAAAAVSLAKLKDPQAHAHLAAYRNELKETLAKGRDTSGDEVAFVIDSLREIEELMAGL